MKLKSAIYSAIVGVLTLSSFLLFTPNPHTTKAESAGGTLPSAYCMRDEYIVYAQNQDNHGYCWNFAATMAASTAIMKATGEYYDFSELWTGVSLYNCGNQYNLIGAGGGISYQYDAMKQSGLMLEADFPYQHSFTVCNENATDYYNFYEKYSNDDLARCIVYDKDTRFSRDNVESIKRHIYEHGSVYLTFSFRKGFVESDGASYLEPNQKDTNSNHAVSVIGWDDNFQREVYLDGAETPTVFKGAWLILNSYTEKSGIDGLSYVFYDDDNIGSVSGYRYEMDTSGDLYFYDKIESGYAYPNALVGKYYGDFTAETGTTKQKNIFYDDVDLEYSYTVSSGARVKDIDIYLGAQEVTDQFNVRIDNETNRFYISKNNADYGQYKVLVTYGNDEKTDTYLNNFFVTHGLVGEEIEYDYATTSFAFNPGRDLEFYSFISDDKNYVIYTNELSGQVSFLPTEQSVYSEKSMSMPTISYEIKDGKSCTSSYTVTSNSGYALTYNFIFEYHEDTTLQPVNVYYDLGGGVNHSKNYRQELASPTQGLTLYEPTRPGYTFAGWYLDYGNGSKAVPKKDGLYQINWEDIHHLGETPSLRASSYYKQYYNNSNTVFVYAQWEEAEYYNVSLTINGEGTSQIDKEIRVGAEDSVKYLLKPKSGWCLSEVTINGEPVGGDELVEIMKYGLVLKDLDRDVSITATFFEGVYLSLKYGENIQTAYVIGTYRGESKKFYNGDCIPAQYFESSNPIRPPVGGRLPTDKDVLFNDIDFDDLDWVKTNDNNLFFIDSEGAGTRLTTDMQALTPIVLGTSFTLVVELRPDSAEYTYVLDGVGSYMVVESGIFKKTVGIRGGAGLSEINVGSAVEKPIEKVEVSYSVNENIVDHYLSADPDAESGEQESAVYDAGQIVYLFIKLQADSPAYYYYAPYFFESVGDQWYRKAVYVDADSPNLGEIAATSARKTYTVTWKNWDGRAIYSEKYYYGEYPVFYNEYGESKDYPVRPNEGEYSYIFIGWDKDLERVTGNTAYTAVYVPMRQYTVHVEPTENGSITPDGDNSMNRLDKHTYIFTPDPGYQVKDVIVNGISVGALSSYTFSDVNEDQTLRVEFEKVKYLVNVLCGENGSADPTGAIEVEYGSSIVIHITTAEFFAIGFIKVDGLPVAVSGNLTIENVVKNTLVEIAFKQVIFRITTESFGKGDVTPSCTVAVGGSVRVDFHAKFFSKVKDVRIDGVSVGAVDYYTFVNVVGGHTVVVEYETDVWLIVILSLTAAVLTVGAILLPLGVKKRKKRLHSAVSEENRFHIDVVVQRNSKE